MRQRLVLTLTGPDRVGIVERVTRQLLDHGANIETSRMARLGGEFAILLLASLPEGSQGAIAHGFEPMTSAGYKLTMTATHDAPVETPANWRAVHIEVEGADHEGIIHEVARYLSQQGINIESMDTETGLAPVSGSPLFMMEATIAVPPEVDLPRWEAGLREVAERQNVELVIREEPGV